MIDTQTLAAERRGFFLATRGAVWLPMTGAVFWSVLGALGFVWSPRRWCVVMLSVGVVALPVGVVFFRWLVGRLEPKSPLATLIGPALIPVALSLGMALAVFRSDSSLVPLALVVGLASHWPAVGWLFDTVIFAVHTVVRVVVAVSLWMVLPSGRFTWLPISIGVIYALTALWILARIRRVQAGAPGADA